MVWRYLLTTFTASLTLATVTAELFTLKRGVHTPSRSEQKQVIPECSLIIRYKTQHLNYTSLELLGTFVLFWWRLAASYYTSSHLPSSHIITIQVDPYTKVKSSMGFPVVQWASFLSICATSRRASGRAATFNNCTKYLSSLGYLYYKVPCCGMFQKFTTLHSFWPSWPTCLPPTHNRPTVQDTPVGNHCNRW